MQEFLENLLYSATFPAMDQWRRFSAAPEPPPESVMRVFVNMELRLYQRYGTIELERLVEAARVRRDMKNLWGKLQGGAMLPMLMGMTLYLATPLFYPRTGQT